MTTPPPEAPPASRSGATKVRASSPWVAILRYTLQSCLPKRRILLLLPLAGAVLFGLLSLTADEVPAEAFALVAGSAVHGLILPITCLVLGDALLGAEIRSGTFAFTWLSPVPFSTIVLGRWLGGCLIATAILAPAVALGALVADAPDSVVPAMLAAITGSAAYLAVFVAVGATFKRPVVWSLGIVILVERLLGAALGAIAQLSPGWLSQAVLVGLTDTSDDLYREGVPHGWGAVVRLAIVAGFALLIATRRLRRLRPASAAD